MHADCEFCVKRDICTKDVPKPCKYRYTEEERIADQASDRFGAILNNAYLHPTYRKKKEEQKMKATSKQEIKNIRDISFSFVSCPIEGKSELTIVATTDDDIFEFVFEGEHIIQSCEKAGMFIGWEKDQKIRELEEENKELKKAYDNVYESVNHVLKEKQELKEEYEYKLEDLQHKYNLEKAANEAQRKFIKEYAGKGTEIEFNYAIGDDNEDTYVILDKEEYKTLKNIQNNVRLHGMDFTPDELVNRIFELEKKNLARQKAYDILDKALKDSQRNCNKWYEKWVKMQSEQDSHKNPVDNVNHPSHYTGKYECIDVMQDVFGNEATDNFCLCNAFKYIWRARKKNGLEDVKKAVWYLNKYIEEAEKDGEDKVSGT